MPDLLPAIELETAPGPVASVIWLHGLGADGNDFVPIVPELGLPPARALRFIFPHAPVRAVTINNGMRMRAWYDIAAADLNNRADISGVRQSTDQVEGLIAREKGRGVPAAHIVLAGFSQGGAIALYAGLRHAERLAGILALSTYLVQADRLPAEAAAANRDVPIFMAHGTADPVVRFEWGLASRRALEANGNPVEWHQYPIEHSLCLEEVRAIGAWLAKGL
jgi:phospholipase/carboxylesterase